MSAKSESGHRRLCLFLVVILAAVVALPSQGVEIAAGQATAYAGQTTSVPVRVNNSAGVSAFQLDLRYDPALLSETQVTPGPALAGNGWCFSSRLDAGRVQVLAYNDQALFLPPGEQELLRLSFRAGAAANGTQAVIEVRRALLSDAGGEEIACTTANGQVLIRRVARFAFDTVPSPQDGGPDQPVPFPVTVRALLPADQPATGYEQTCNLSDLSGALQPTQITFSDGVWAGPVTITADCRDDRLQVADGLGAVGESNPFDVVQHGILIAPRVTGVPQYSVTVPIVLRGAEGVAGIQFDLCYDPALLIFQSLALGPLLGEGWTARPSQPAPGTVRVIAYHTETQPLGAVSGVAVVLNFTVAIAAQHGATCPLVITNLILGDPQGDPMEVATFAGSFTAVRVSRFAFTEIPSPQHGDAYTPLPFTVTITTLDEADQVVDAFAGSATLSDVTGTLALSPGGGTTAWFSGGTFLGDLVISQPADTDRISCVHTLDPGATGQSNDFAVIGEADPTGDGETNVLDVVCDVSIALESYAATPAELAAADVNEDSQVDVCDVIITQNIALGIGGAPVTGAPRATAIPMRQPICLAPAATREGRLLAVPIHVDRAHGLAGFEFALDLPPGMTPVGLRAGRLLASREDWLLNCNLLAHRARVLCFQGGSQPLAGAGGCLVEVLERVEGGVAGMPSLRDPVVTGPHGEKLTCRLRASQPRRAGGH